MTRYRTRQLTPRPISIRTAADRGQALRHWLDLHKVPLAAFATASGISRQQLYRYLGGEALDPEGRAIDLAYMPQDRAEGLITAMGLTDWEAWEVLGIPEDAKATFRTFRPYPEGHGRKVSEVIELRLTVPMVGEIPLPAGTLIRMWSMAKCR